MAKRSEVSAKQRSEAVLALLRREEPAARLSRRHGVAEQTLYRWRDEFLAGGEAALSGKSKGWLSRHGAQNPPLRRARDQRTDHRGVAEAGGRPSFG